MSLSVAHQSAIARAGETMRSLLWARAAVAWLQLVAPRSMPGVAPDPEGVAVHLMLFARHAVYWERLCGLFEQHQLSDRWGPR